jgi:lipopolysaccharide export system ATP-binding protein
MCQPVQDRPTARDAGTPTETIKEDRPMPLLQVQGLEKWYGRRQVVNGVDYEVERGEVVGLLGPNGAGKTTSFRMTIGMIDADGGKVMFDGRDVTKVPMYLRAKAGMGYLAQDSSVFRQLSVEDNLMAILETRKDMSRKQRKDRQNELLDQFGLSKIRKTKANRVSGGERRRLEIARSLITEPKMIMLDEPFAGIDPKTVAEIQDQIRDLVDRYNIGILLTDHQFRETLEVTDRCYLIREGRVFAYGNREQILNNPDVRRHYIGERFDVGHLLERRRPVSLSHHAAQPATVDSPPPATDTTSASRSLPADASCPPATAIASAAASRPTSPSGPRLETDEFEDDGTSILLGSFVTTELFLGDIEQISVQSTIGTDAADLPPAPPPPDEPVPGVYEEPNR